MMGTRLSPGLYSHSEEETSTKSSGTLSKKKSVFIKGMPLTLNEASTR